MDTGPFESSPIERYRNKNEWDATAAELVGTMLDRWHLTAGEAYVGGEAASVLQVTVDGVPAVLKVGFPHLEGIWEAVALETWGAPLAPAVLRQEGWTWSMLLERVSPGIPLSRSGLPADDALAVAAALFRDISSKPRPMGVATLPQVMEVYLEGAHARLAGQAAELARLGAADLLDRGLAEVAALAETDGAGAFLHGDFNPGNVISAGERWKVIDPKPMVGDAEFDLFPLLEQVGTPLARPHARETIEERLLELTRIVECDAGRTARWCFARSALNLSWLLENGNQAAAARVIPEIRIWESLLE